MAKSQIRVVTTVIQELGNNFNPLETSELTGHANHESISNYGHNPVEKQQGHANPESISSYSHNALEK